MRCVIAGPWRFEPLPQYCARFLLTTRRLEPGTSQHPETFTGSLYSWLLVSLPGMPKRKRRTRQPAAAPVPAPEPIAKIKKRRRRRRKPAAESVAVLAEPKTVMQLIFENQRAQLDRLNEELRAKLIA